MPREGDEHRVDALLASLAPRADDQLAAASAWARSQRRWSQQLAAESSTMAGVLLSLAERGAPVTVHCGGWSHRGRLGTVTAPLCMVERPDGVALVPTDAITMVEAEAPVADDRRPAAGPDLATVLAHLVPEHAAVRLQLTDGTEVAGTLSGLGKDVAVVRLTSSVATARLSAIAGCVVLGRGNRDRPGYDQQCDQEVESDGVLASLDDFGSG